MRRTTLVVLVISAAVVVVALILSYTAPSAVADREREARLAEAQDAPPAEPPPSLTVDALVARPSEARLRVDVSCELDAVRHVVIGAEVPGQVVEILAEEHALVEKGAVLVRLKPELPRAAVARARAALQSAEARLELATAELRRQQNLKGQGVASISEFDRTQSEARTAEASVAEARASLLDAETRLAKTEIRAPFSGVVGEIELEPGAYVRTGDPVVELADLTEIEVSVGLSDQEVLAIAAGDAVVLRVDALGGRAFEGRVLRPGRTPDATTRKYPVPIRVANPEGALLPGMLGTVTFTLGEPRSVLRVPRRAVQREFDLEYLYVLDGAEGVGTRVERRRVSTEPVPFRPELLEVREGLLAGERIAVSGLRDLRGGELVRTRELAPASSEVAADLEASAP